MGGLIVVWLISAVCVTAIVFVVKSVRRRRLARPRDFHWPGLIVISLIIGAVPAYIYQNQSSRSVEVPAGVAERPSITGTDKN
ncbi:MAG: hypothetical protein QF578_12975 [Alphaproteobacteria bacterium]|jgi:glucan phosphoethanolaminetransferase (alkaline phosphatase superfamily)|nr:hypothetical protein [Alphaproteobacteria bacterium]MDP6565731.1 hypothetical protein [Alphaproteobacteria bacterium]MDP6814605.1 hypothetical protein [Alphaproteobacteria bacterium]